MSTLNAPRVITKIIAYLRLSKPKKGKNKRETIEDAYGIEDQRREIARIAAMYGARIIAEFTEVETGTRKKVHRPELEKAISMARSHRATIVVGKQDRLARNVHLVTGLFESGVPFIVAERPDQTELEMQMRAIIDQEEARRISERTKRGLAVAKEKGVLLGSARLGAWEGREHLRGFRQATKASSEARAQRARDAYRWLIDDMVAWNKQGMSLELIAEKLNKRGHVTTAGKPFHKGMVHRIFALFNKVLRPRHTVHADCAKCGSHFWASDAQQKQNEKHGEPYICARCAHAVAV